MDRDTTKTRIYSESYTAEGFCDVEAIPTTLDTFGSNAVQKRKISKADGMDRDRQKGIISNF